MSHKLHYNVNLLMLLTILFFIVILGMTRKKVRFPTSILFSLSASQVFDNTSIPELLKELNSNRFKSYFNAEHVLIEVRSIKSLILCNKQITFDATIFLIMNCLKIRYYPNLIKNIIKIALNSKQNLNFKSFKREVLDATVFRILKNEMVVNLDLITTNSSLSLLPKAMEHNFNGKRIMLWYSTNSRIFKHRKANIGLSWRVQDIQEFVDLHLVWNESECDFLKSIGITNVFPVGSILFQNRLTATKSNSCFKVTIFDVTPISIARQSQLRIEHNFLSEEKMLKDLRALLHITDSFQKKYGNYIEFRLKPKRRYTKYHSKKYLAEIRESHRSGKIKLLNPSENLYKLVSESDLVISTPYTSPATLAKELHVDVVYFATNRDNWILPKEHDGIKIFTSASELMIFLEGLITGKLQYKYFKVQ